MDDRTQQDAVILVEGRTLRCQGAWTLPAVARVERVLKRIAWPPTGSLIFEASAIHAFDTGGAVILYRALTEARRRGCEVTIEGLGGRL